MSDHILSPDKRPTGYYWIADEEEPQIAWWSADSQKWGFIGGYEGESEHEITVLSGPLQPPP